MAVLKRKRSAELTGSDEELRERLRQIRVEQREIVREHGGRRFREDARAEVDRLEADLGARLGDAIGAVAFGGNPRALGSPTETVDRSVREAILLDHAVHGGFLARLREAVEAADGFCTVTRQEMDALLRPFEDEASAIGAELGRRHDERVELRRRLAELQAVES